MEIKKTIGDDDVVKLIVLIGTMEWKCILTIYTEKNGRNQLYITYQDMIIA